MTRSKPISIAVESPTCADRGEISVFMTSIPAAVCMVFFFQAEDGIRDGRVTGVQTCALPISGRPPLPRGFASLDEAAEEVAAYLPQRRRRKDRYELAQLLRRGADGRLRWHWDPAMLDTVAREGERHQQRLLNAARNIDVPTLLVSGGRSDIVSDATVKEFLDAVPHATHVQIPHAAHTLAGDDNAAFTAAIEPFLNTLDLGVVSAPCPRAPIQRGLP